jgi:Uma2 family endonuclease
MSEKRVATYQDVLDAPEHMVAELIDGELFLSPRPGNPHGVVTSRLHGELYARFSGGGAGSNGWLFIVEPELHLGDRVLVPDIAGWRTSRLPTVPDAAYVTVAPDWICETASKSTEKLDRKRKLPIYASAGVGYAWLVHPRLRSLEVFEAHERRWTLVETFSDNDRARAVPFEDFELDLSRLWWGLPLISSEGSEFFVEY